MKNFMYSIPTKVAFGRGQIVNLPAFVREFGNSVLLVYGGGSIHRNGIYETAVKLLTDAKIRVEELAGVEPNPQIGTVRKGIDICREKNIDVILPIGGGSAIDCAKAIAAGFFYDGDPWDLILDNEKVKKALPIICVLTLAATGSEMDVSAVISNEKTGEKKELDSELVFPKYSILDPSYTFTVPAYQTAAGTADIMSHVFEIYFNGDHVLEIQKGLMESILRTCIHYGPIAVSKPEDEAARANLMWAASWAINGFINCGTESYWPCHTMEHPLSGYYSITHGHGMAIIENAWMEYIVNDKTMQMFSEYGKNVFGLGDEWTPMERAKKAISCTKEVYRHMGLSDTLRSVGVNSREKFALLAQRAIEDAPLEKCNYPLMVEDVINIYESCF